MAIPEHERVVLRTPLPEEGLEPGDVGTVVYVYDDGVAYEVEFMTLDGATVAVVTLEADQVRRVSGADMTHTRRMSAEFAGGD